MRKYPRELGKYCGQISKSCANKDLLLFKQFLLVTHTHAYNEALTHYGQLLQPLNHRLNQFFPNNKKGRRAAKRQNTRKKGSKLLAPLTFLTTLNRLRIHRQTIYSNFLCVFTSSQLDVSYAHTNCTIIQQSVTLLAMLKERGNFTQVSQFAFRHMASLLYYSLYAYLSRLKSLYRVAKVLSKHGASTPS